MIFFLSSRRLCAIAVVMLLLSAFIPAAGEEAGAPPAQTTAGKPDAAAAPAGTDAKPRKHKHRQETSGGSASADAAPAHVPGKTEAELLRHQAESARHGVYDRWKMGLPFWWRKAVIFLELAAFICFGVLLGQIIEVAGLVRYLAVITWPFQKLGALPKVVGAPFIMAFQSGAVANSMLVTARDAGELDRRQLYTSVLVVSCLSLFVHLPTFIVPLGAAFGLEAAMVFFGVRFAAILAELLVILLVSSLLLRSRCKPGRPQTGGGLDLPLQPLSSAPELCGARLGDTSGNLITGCSGAAPGDPRSDEAADSGARRLLPREGFWQTVWRRSRRTLVRLLWFVIPTFLVMSGLEYWGLFETLQGWLDRCNLSWLPPQTPAIVAAQAVSLYNGAIIAGSFVDGGSLTTHLAVVILLFGSLITAPVRTLKHALPTYAAVLGLRAGTVMAISAQLLRLLFLGAAIFVLALLWF